MPFADRVLVMDKGKIIADGIPKEVGQMLDRENHKMFLAMPVPMRIYAHVPNTLDCPVTVRDGRHWLDSFAATRTLNTNKFKSSIAVPSKERPSVELREAWFRYEKELPDVVKGASFSAYPGEFLAILGGNGTGKTTALSLLSGINRPYRGKVFLFGKEISEISDSEKFNGMLECYRRILNLCLLKRQWKWIYMICLKVRNYPKMNSRNVCGEFHAYVR